jgi:hypothetical protein
VATVLSDDDRRRLGATFDSSSRIPERSTPRGHVAVVASRSYVVDRPTPERCALLDEVRELLHTHRDLAGRETFELPYVTVAVRSRRKYP